MMHAPCGEAGEVNVASWTPEELRAHIVFMQRLNRDLVASGELVVAEVLAAPGAAKLVRAPEKASGAPAITDGPFAESKEFLVGFWIVDVDRPERTYEIAATASSAMKG